MSNSMKDHVTSKDGTTIGYRKVGHGPGLVLVHGAMRSSQDFMKLAKDLSDSFTVYVPDRRGRGLSGSPGDHYSIRREVEDMQALIVETGATFIFGLSAGGLVTLRTTLATPDVQKAAVYDPALSVDNSFPTDWLPRYEQEISENKPARALVTIMKGVGIEPVLEKFPRFILVPLVSLMMKIEGRSKEESVTLRSLVSTMKYDTHLVEETSDTLEDYISLEAPVLLMGGGKSANILKKVLGDLARTLPNPTKKIFPKLNHGSPEGNKNKLISDELTTFFLEGK